MGLPRLSEAMAGVLLAAARGETLTRQVRVSLDALTSRGLLSRHHRPTITGLDLAEHWTAEHTWRAYWTAREHGWTTRPVTTDDGPPVPPGTRVWLAQPWPEHPGDALHVRTRDGRSILAGEGDGTIAFDTDHPRPTTTADCRALPVHGASLRIGDRYAIDAGQRWRTLTAHSRRPDPADVVHVAARRLDPRGEHWPSLAAAGARFVHATARDRIPGRPVSAWPCVVARVMRVRGELVQWVPLDPTVPGGWVQRSLLPQVVAGIVCTLVAPRPTQPIGAPA